MASPPQGLNPDIDRDDFIEACVQAAVRWDVNAYYMVAIAQIESEIRNVGTTGSDAFGPFQIKEATWEDFRGESGFSAAHRFDPFKQPFVAGNIAARGIKALRPVLPGERMPTDAELYLTHLFGQRGATVILSGGRNDSIETALNRVFPTNPGLVADILKANSSLLTEQESAGGASRRPRTVAGVLSEVDRRLLGARKIVLPDGLVETVEPQLQGDLVARAKDGNTTFWIIDKFDEFGGGQFLLKQVAGRAVEVLKSDAVVFPVSSPLVPDNVADVLNEAFQEPPEPGPADTGPPVQPSSDVKKLVLDKAIASDGTLVTRDVPSTNHGRLACAWAVNQIVRLALGKPIDGGRTNGLSTSNMGEVLKAKHIARTADQVAPGLVVISPTRGGNVGHVGIVGRLNANRDETVILSNSSNAGMFSHHFTIAKWNRQYRDKQHLPVLYYELDARKL
jgi:hypothetical protein